MVDGGEHAVDESAPGDGDEGGASRSVVARTVARAVVHGDSWALRTYALVAVLVSCFVLLLVVLAVPEWLDRSQGVLERVSAAFLVLVGLGVVAGTLAPIAFVERRRRAGRPERQRALALAGYGYLCSLYLALLASAPAGLRSEPSGSVAPAVEALYALPQVAGIGVVALGFSLVLAVEYGLDREADDPVRDRAS